MTMFKLKKLSGGDVPMMVEVFKLGQEGDIWKVVPNLQDLGPAGFEFARPQYQAQGWSRKGVWSPCQVKKKFEPGEVRLGQVPVNMTPKNVAEAICGKSVPGLHVDPAVTDMVIKYCAKKISEKFKDFDAIAPVPSSKKISLQLAQEISKLTGKKILPQALQKQNNPAAISLAPEVDTFPPESQKKLRATLARIQRDMKADPASFKVRRYIDKKDMRLFKGLHDIGADVTDVTQKETPRILLVDDLVASGESMLDAQRTLELMDFKIIGMATAFIMEQ